MRPTTNALRRAVTTAAVVAATLPAAIGTAWADDRNFSEPVDRSFTTLDALLVYVGVPLLVCAVVTLLVYAPHLARRPRYRPGRAYEGDLLVQGGPAQGAPALEPGDPGKRRAGGASAGW